MKFKINYFNYRDIDLSKNTSQQARIEDITLKEDYGDVIMTQDDDFGDMGFGMNTILMNDDFFNSTEKIREEFHTPLRNVNENSNALYNGG